MIIAIVLLLCYGAYIEVYHIDPYTYTEVHGFIHTEVGTYPIDGPEQHGLSTGDCITGALFLLVAWWLAERVAKIEL